MTSNNLIKRLRLSFIWTETFINLFDKDQTQAPLAFVGTPILYKQKFSDLQSLYREQNQSECQEINLNNDLGLPWLSSLKREKHYFWGHYLKDNRPSAIPLSHINSNRAWKQLVPFRSVQNLPLITMPGFRIVLEGFYYPFGFAFVIHLEYFNLLTTQEVIDIAFKIRNNSSFSLQTNKKCNQDAQNIYQKYQGISLTLDEVAELCLNTIRRVNLGLAEFPENGISSFEPFTVFTPLQGSRINPSQNISHSGIHQMLEAVTTWKGASQDSLPNLNDVSFQFPVTYSSQVGSLIYHHRRGRAVWFPVPLISQRKRRTLSCYHRNMVLTALHVESLSKLMILAAEDFINQGLLTPVTYEFCAKRAAGILGQLYGCAKTYSSPSIKIQIDENDWKDSINAVRSNLNVGKELTSV